MECRARLYNRFGPGLHLLLICIMVVWSATCEKRTQDEDSQATSEPTSKAMSESTRVSSTEANTKASTGAEALSVVTLAGALSSEESAYLEELRGRGGLRAAIGTATTVYEPPSDEGEPDGFHYHLVRRMAEDLDIPLVIQPVRFMQFFSKDGIVPAEAKTNPAYRYTPDLLKEVDLYVGTLSILPWRDVFLRFIPLYHTRLVYVYQEEEEISQPRDLSRRTVALLPNTTYERWLNKRAAELNFTFDTIAVGTGDEAIAEIAVGRADVTVADADIAIRQIRDFPFLTIGPAGDTTDLLCWAVAEANEILASIIEKYMTAAKADGTFARIWEKYFEFTFYDYLSVVGTGS